MKASEEYREAAQEMFITGIILLAVGFLWLAAFTVLIILEVRMNIHPIFAMTPCLIFFAGSAWAFFVECPYEKRIQRVFEEKEAKEETERAKQLSIK